MAAAQVYKNYIHVNQIFVENLSYIGTALLVVIVRSLLLFYVFHEAIVFHEILSVVDLLFRNSGLLIVPYKSPLCCWLRRLFWQWEMN